MNKLSTKFVGIFILSLVWVATQAQELNCTVSVVTSQLKTRQQTDVESIRQLEAGIKNFMNNTRWTNDVYADGEKIKCNLLITLRESKTQNVFSGRAQFQVLRPVFGTTYESVIFQYVDQNFDFSFAPEDRQMIFNEQNFSSNLTSMLAFYAFVGLATHYDTFKKFGGNDFVQRAFNVVNLANVMGGPWTQSVADRRTRYWLIENLQNQQFRPYREGLYTYHRLVLDDISNNPAEKRKMVLSFIKDLQAIQTLNTISPVLNSFFDAKAIELVNLLSEATLEERNEAFKMFSEMTPDKIETFRPLTSTVTY